MKVKVNELCKALINNNIQFEISDHYANTQVITIVNNNHKFLDILVNQDFSIKACRYDLLCFFDKEPRSVYPQHWIDLSLVIVNQLIEVARKEFPQWAAADGRIVDGSHKFDSMISTS